jgi:myo-inositol-1(or 4)-monophosphatase
MTRWRTWKGLVVMLEAAELDKRRRVAEEAARAAGEIQRSYFGTNVAFEVKSDPRDVLTRADIESQDAIKAIIRESFPHDIIAGEEDGLSREETSHLLEGAAWTVDPLDATQGFVHNFPVFGPGIAYVINRQALVGVMYLPVYDELFSAARGLGAKINGQAIRVAPAKALRDSLVGIHIREAGEAAVREFLETTGRILSASHGIRLLGAPMFSLAYVAAGRLDCFATLSPTKLGPWDLAPAGIIVEEAGGAIATQTGAPFDLMQPGVSAASTPALLKEMFLVARGA